MRIRFARLLVCLIVLAVAAPISAQGAPSVVVADFEDQSVDGSRIGAARLSADLSTLLAAAGRGRLTVVPVDQLRDVMRTRGLGPSDLLDPGRGREVAEAVGAQWLVTGRWTLLELDRPEPPLTPTDVAGPTLAHAALEIRVLDVTTRRLVLNDLFSTTTVATGSHTLREVARVVLRKAAASIAGL